MKRVLFVIFFFIIFSSSFSLAKNNERITVEEIKDILLLDPRGAGLDLMLWEEKFEKLKKSKTLEKRIQTRNIASCMYKSLLKDNYLDSYAVMAHTPKECYAKIIRSIFSRSEKAQKRRPGDIFYALEAIEQLVFDSKEISKFVRSYNTVFEDMIKGANSADWAPRAVCIKRDIKLGQQTYACSFFREYTLKKLEKYKKDPSNEKVLGKPLIKYIKNVRMVRSIREKIGTGNYALLGDMLNAVVIDVKKNNISPNLKIRRALLKKYSLILRGIKKKLDEDKYKSIDKDVSKLSKTYENLNTLTTTTNEIAVNIDEAVNNIFDVNKLVQSSVLNAKNNEEEKLLALTSINFMDSLIDSILSVIPEKYFTEQKILSQDLFKEYDLAKLDVVINSMMNKNKEIKSAELTKSMDLINKSFKSLNPYDVVKTLDNLGMKNNISRTFTQDTAAEMADKQIKDNLDQNKSEYTFRSLNSLIVSLNRAMTTLPKIEFDIVVIDYNSKKKDLEQIKQQLKKSNFKNSIISLDINEFINNIKKVNAKNEKVTDNQMSNMSNIHKSLLVGKKPMQ